MELENIKKLIKIDEELLSVVKAQLNALDFDECNPLEGFAFVIGEASFAFVEHDSEPWNDEGKYQYSSTSYQLVAFDRNKAAYPCDTSIVAEYDLFAEVSVSRSGSYYTDWWYQYESPTFFKYEIEIVPEVIIPQHEEIKKEYLK